MLRRTSEWASDVHITRADNWAQNEGHEILASEWLDLVDHDPELQLAGHNGPYFAIWSGDPDDPEAWLDWDDGNVSTKNPNERLLEKMVEIARRLGARVQGDDGEWYPDATAVSDVSRPSFFANTPLLSFLLATGALLALAVAIPLDSSVRREYPVGTPMPLKWAAALAGVAVVGSLSWLTSLAFALMTLIGRQRSARFAWAGIRGQHCHVRYFHAHRMTHLSHLQGSCPLREFEVVEKYKSTDAEIASPTRPARRPRNTLNSHSRKVNPLLGTRKILPTDPSRCGLVGRWRSSASELSRTPTSLPPCSSASILSRFRAVGGGEGARSSLFPPMRPLRLGEYSCSVSEHRPSSCSTVGRISASGWRLSTVKSPETHLFAPCGVCVTKFRARNLPWLGGIAW